MQTAAPLVLEAASTGDALAAGIVREQTRALAWQARRLVAQSPPIEPRLALFGGLAASAYYRGALQEALREALPAWSCLDAPCPPVSGALRLARAAGSGRASDEGRVTKGE